MPPLQMQAATSFTDLGILPCNALCECLTRSRLFVELDEGFWPPHSAQHNAEMLMLHAQRLPAPDQGRTGEKPSIQPSNRMRSRGPFTVGQVCSGARVPRPPCAALS